MCVCARVCAVEESVPAVAPGAPVTDPLLVREGQRWRAASFVVRTGESPLMSPRPSIERPDSCPLSTSLQDSLHDAAGPVVALAAPSIALGIPLRPAAPTRAGGRAGIGRLLRSLTPGRLRHEGSAVIGSPVGVADDSLAAGSSLTCGADPPLPRPRNWFVRSLTPMRKRERQRLDELGTRLCYELRHTDTKLIDACERDIDDALVAFLSKSLPLSECVSLLLRANTIGYSGVLELSRSVTASKLSVIDLSHNPLGTDGVIAIARQLPLTAVHRLALASVGAGDRAAQVCFDMCLDTYLNTCLDACLTCV